MSIHKHQVRDLVAVDQVRADLVPGAGARRPGGRRPGAWAVGRGPRRLVRAPWCLQGRPGGRGTKKRAGSLAARALALFYAVSST